MFEHKSYRFQTEAKMKALGCKEFEFVTRREDIFLCIINYLGCVTLTQFNELTQKTPMSNRAILIRLEKERLITADHINKEIYYRCTKKGNEHLRTFGMPRKQIKIKKRKHLEKINDFFLHLFRGSCKFATIKNEVTFLYGDSNNLYKDNELDEIDAQYVHRFIADAQIKLVHNNRNYNIVLEQDNGTERTDVLKDKISNYINFILHQELKQTEIEIYIFRVDVDTTSFQYKKFQKLFKQEAVINNNEIKKLANIYKCVKQSVDVTDFFEEAKGLCVQGDYSKRKFLDNISSKKARIEEANSVDEILLYSKFKSKINAKRLKDIKKLLTGDMIVDKFYNTKNNSVFYDITRHNSYSSVDSRIDIEKIMLRTNFTCGDNRLAYLLNYYLFSETDYFKYSIESYFDNIGYKVDLNEIHKETKIIKFGHESIKFDFTTSLNIAYSTLDIIILFPNILISDLFKLKYISSLEDSLIDSSLISTVFLIIMDEDIDDEIIFNLENKECRAVFSINIADDGAWGKSFMLP